MLALWLQKDEEQGTHSAERMAGLHLQSASVSS